MKIEEVVGIGPKTAAYLRQHGVEDSDALLAVGVALLSSAPGFGEARAVKVLAGITAGQGVVEQTSAGPAKAEKKTKKKKKEKGKKHGKDKPTKGKKTDSGKGTKKKAKDKKKKDGKKGKKAKGKK